MIKLTKTPLFALAATASLFYAVPGVAGDHTDVHVTTSQEMQESNEAERAEMAAEVLKASLTGEDQSIPKALLEEAHAVVVIPHVVKGAFLVGGQYGKGLVSWRDDNGDWSAPAFVSMGGASYGFQAGVKAVDLVLVVTDPNGLQALMDDELKLGAGVGVTAGPIGRDAEAATNLTLDTGIYSYSRSKGLFAGASLEGAVLTLDDDANRKVYGDTTTGKVLLSSKHGGNDTVKPFLQSLDTYVPDLDS
ncbi:MAG: lipid-binding SYLF domain-containing protein [Candidatus Eisenbacteria bacterium]